MPNFLQAENCLTDLDGLCGCPALEVLHARDNRISSLTDFTPMTKLKKINLRYVDIRNAQDWYWYWYLKLPNIFNV